ncbi:inner centromere protein [Myxozyma melibiosi]|uniref:Inner centromere protein n=1 Tax=Myxozyma melibiosi TaxID=54550 RepID=A0ABR1EYW6_9ASCO
MKRNFQIDGEPGRLKNSLVPTTASMQDQSKRRRTDEMSGSPIEAKVRHSVVRKDHLQGGGASAPGSKAIGGRQVPIVEGVKFSNEKIRFAGSASAASSTASSQESNVQPTSSSTATGSVGGPARRTTNSGENGALPSTTPGRPNLKNASQHGSHVRLSQLAAMPVNSGDHIVLPEIYSESEDDEEDSVILDWAHSPYLRETLRKQQPIDPDTVFGPVPPLSMEEVFRNRAGVSAARFRPRSSSANWSNNDRLTPQEIEAYAQEMGYNRPQPQQQDAE